MPFVESGGIRFYYEIGGFGGPLVAFQHGLGGDVSQPQSVLGSSDRLRALSFDCRGHGRTHPLGPLNHLKFSTFADDLSAILDAVHAGAVAVGGISMGAGVALQFALRPDARKGPDLIAARVAGCSVPGQPKNPPRPGIVAAKMGAIGAKELLLADPEFARTRAVNRDNAFYLSLLGFYYLEAKIFTLSIFSFYTPCHAPEAWRTILVPTLVLTNDSDAIHPVVYGQQLAAGIPAARLVEIAPKESDPALHAREAREAIEGFVCRPEP